MHIATAVGLYSTSPPTVGSSPHTSHCTSCSVTEIEFHSRAVAAHYAGSKPVMGGLSSLFASTAVRYSSGCAGDVIDTSSPSNLARRGSHSDPCAVRDSNENWSDAFNISAKLRERSPVSVLQGPLSCSSGPNSGRLSIVSRDKSSARGLASSDRQSGSSYRIWSLTADVQRPLLRTEDFQLETEVAGAHGSCLDRESTSSPAQRQGSVDLLSGKSRSRELDLTFAEIGEAKSGTLGFMRKASSSLSELFCEPLFPEPFRSAEEILRDAQERHDIFRDQSVIKAFWEAEKAHSGQIRASGDLYLSHCVETAMILAGIGASNVVIAAGLLHDTLDDTSMEYQQLHDLFGADIADLVEGVSRLSEFSKLARDNNTANKTAEADRLHTMFLSMVDVRVVLIKLADRLHNMKTLGALPHHKQCRIANETLEIFAPLANRLGIWSWKAELEDLSFKHLKHREHQELATKLTEGVRETTIMSAIHKLHQGLSEKGVQYHDLCGRPKNLYSVYSKMLRKGQHINEIYDVRGLRLIVANEKDCYTALETVHKLWPCVPGKLKDYISQPKPNGYQSLHTVVWGEDGLPLEIQIRTKEMHHLAEFGVAAHWRYKEGNIEHSAFVLQMVEWARWVLTWQNEIIDTKLRLCPVETDLRPPCPFPLHNEGCPHKQLFCGPPQNEGDPLFVIILEDEKMMVQELPGGSTVADLLHRRVDEDSLAVTFGGVFCDELRPIVNHKVVDDVHQRLRMGDLVEMVQYLPSKCLSEYREKIKRMFDDTVVQDTDRRPTLRPSWARTSQVAMA